MYNIFISEKKSLNTENAQLAKYNKKLFSS